MNPTDNTQPSNVNSMTTSSSLDELREKMFEIAARLGEEPSYAESIIALFSHHLEQETELLKAEVKFLKERRQMERNKYKILAESFEQETLKARMKYERSGIAFVHATVIDLFSDKRALEKLDKVIQERLSQLTTNKSKENK